ncbi:ATP-binding protein [Chryseobacterium sp. EO14]|uniref:ATP-binding protein n=2 Tax=Chryseobacterium TaxID=59732 RepID=UPI00210B5417|nr:ATP-binding protein [Chryseobacterium sp. EO14]MCQ4142417.1 ATP-binding protein [Chryseobacterium sp. EO14]
MDIKENNIKLLAIRPLENCDCQYSKTLENGTLYPFYQTYSYKNDHDGNIVEIESFAETDILYNHDIDGSENDIALSISAIVGKNGSGKSSLVELFYIANYVLGLKAELITIDQSDFLYRTLNKELEIIEEKLKVEIFYELDGEYYCLRIDRDNSNNYQTKNIKVINVLHTDSIQKEDLFYSIIINYSLHGLNRESNGKWLWKIFNKNDGYRAPIVINPYRDWGNINIFSEAHLAQSRLLANMRPDANNSLGNVLSDRKISGVRLLLNLERLRNLDGIQMDEVIQKLEYSVELKRGEIFKRIYQSILETDESPRKPEEVVFGNHLEMYIFKKVIKIVRNYREYRAIFYNEFESGRKRQPVPSFRMLDEYLSLLKTDRSHVTLKLRQALNAYRFNMLKKEGNDNISRSRRAISFNIKDFTERVAAAWKNFPTREIVEFIPIAMFMPKIELSDGSNFMSLSSGEQQFIHSMQAVLYHLNNLNSVSILDANEVTEEEQRIQYKHVNIILDEIELYFHPEFQRRYLFELIHNIRSMNLHNIKAINIMFLTHSPFILSDIPKSNILKLQKGEIVPQLYDTFAGNIHTMLSDSFFMKSTIGEFARQEYSKIINFYNEVRGADSEYLKILATEYKTKQQHFNYIIEIIGEEVLKSVLKNNLSYIEQKMKVNTTEELEIKDLLEKRRKIDEDLKRRGYDQN